MQNSLKGLKITSQWKTEDFQEIQNDLPCGIDMKIRNEAACLHAYEKILNAKSCN
jgi:hypothetical protein